MPLHSLLAIHISVSYTMSCYPCNKEDIASLRQTLASVSLQNEAQTEQGCRDGNGGKIAQA